MLGSWEQYAGDPFAGLTVNGSDQSAWFFDRDDPMPNDRLDAPRPLTLTARLPENLVVDGRNRPRECQSALRFERRA